MYRAKEKGRNNFQFFTRELNALITERLELENKLRRALEREQFLLHYQPRVDLRTRRIDWRRSADPLAAARATRSIAAGALHSARRRDRPDRADRQVGAANRVRAEQGVAGRGLASPSWSR